MIRISNVKVTSLGLVTKGKNRQKFFLLKSDKEEPMTNKNDELESVELQIPIEELAKDKSFLALIKSTVQGLLPVAPEAVEPEPTDAEVVKLAGQHIELAKNYATLAQDYTALEKRLQATEERAIEAEQFVLGTREQQEMGVYLRKAQELPFIPVATDEIAAHLYSISKAAPNDIDWLLETFEVLNKQVATSQLFAEFGSSARPEEKDLVKSAQVLAEKESIPLRDALLRASEKDAAAYIAARRNTN